MLKKSQTSTNAALLLASEGNDTPDEGVLKAAKDCREHSVAALPRMNAKAATIAAQIKKLRRQQRAVAADIARLEEDVLVCDRLLAPIRRVPRDILCEIAFHALPLRPSPLRKQAPLSLSHVSSAWRDAVFSSAILWDTLFLDIQDPNTLKLLERMTQDWFSRARARLLSLFIKFGYPSRDIYLKTDIFRRFLNNLSLRIRHLGLDVYYPADLFSYLNVGVTWRWPNLQSFDFIEGKHWAADEEGDPPPPTLIFEATDNLRQVSMSYRLTSEASACRFLPWNSLTHIVLKNLVRLHYWWEIFQWCPCLQAGQFFVDNFYLWEAPEPQSQSMGRKYTHPDLEALDLVLYCYDESAIGMTVPFTFRKLKSLRINRDNGVFEQRDMNWPRSSCVNSFDSLCMLTLERGWLSRDMDYMVGILSEMVSVSELVVQSIDTDLESDNRDPMVFDAMTATNANVILPRLTILRLSFSGD
ncbi:hypothetical protein NLJ89_g11108 [Agrocybe chaxingu]|uniref:F-box domain-containing protein n=1 Tax=Agrocybe chaxingu TaxID=84603 RepID=A0A9W8JXE3_9AGAR|nr:hypothetical protein NLJ89_g11108 [Agrocybe chaxingu]